MAQAPGFFAHLREERGLRPSSVAHYQHYLRRFQAYLSRIDLQQLSDLSPPVLSAFVIESSAALSKTALVGLCSTLRVFLRIFGSNGSVLRACFHLAGNSSQVNLKACPFSTDQVKSHAFVHQSRRVL